MLHFPIGAADLWDARLDAPDFVLLRFVGALYRSTRVLRTNEAFNTVCAKAFQGTFRRKQRQQLLKKQPSPRLPAHNIPVLQRDPSPRSAQPWLNLVGRGWERQMAGPAW